MHRVLDISPQIKFSEIENELSIPLIVDLTGEIDEEKASNFAATLSSAENAAREANVDIIPLIINSYGGDAYACLDIIDSMLHCKCKIMTVIRGKAMSAGAFIAIQGSPGLRFITPNSQMMIHEVQSGTMGSSTRIKWSAKDIEDLTERIFNMTVKRSKIEKAKLYDLIKDRGGDFYFNANEAKKFGFVDRIGSPELKTTVSVKHEFNYGRKPRA